MRTALEQIKHELGADAVIMSNKKIPEGVELMAAVDYGQESALLQSHSKLAAAKNESDQMYSRDLGNDVVSIKNKVEESSSPDKNKAPADSLSALLQRKVQIEQHKKEHGLHYKNTPNMAATERGEHHFAKSADKDIEQQLKNFTDRLEQGALTESRHSQPVLKSQNDERAQVRNPNTYSAYNEQTQEQVDYTQQNKQASSNNFHQSAEIEQMRQEMLSMRQLLEHQVSGLMWQNMAQKDPTKALMVNRLMALGLTEQVADQIASCLPAYKNEQQAWDAAKALLAQQLNTTNNDIIHRGGVVSLVGPTGVGKTTTIAKLAARFAQIHGADQVALISTDSYRIAGFEQLSTYGRIIGCQVKLAKDGAALDTLLQHFSNKKLVLIDTAGMGQRDMRLAEHLATLITNSRVRIRNYLVLAANTQQRVMQENVERFKKVPLAGCIYTKLDESLSVGEIIATSIQNGLAIGYLTDGQRVPEDIKVANTEKLVTLADRLATKVNCQNSWRPLPTTSTAVGM